MMSLSDFWHYLFFPLLLLLIPVFVAIILYYFRKRIDNEVFFRRESRRHVSRIKNASLQLITKQSHNACATLAWSQSDLLSIIARHNYWGDSDSKSFGALLAIAINVPLRNTKSTVFTEGPRNIEQPMPPNTRDALVGAMNDVLSNETARRARGLFGIIAFNRYVYLPQSLRNSKTIACRFPYLSLNTKQREEISGRFQSFSSQFEKCTASTKTVLAKFRQDERRWQEDIKWEDIHYGKAALDPTVSFSLNICSFLSHLLRSRAMYIADTDYERIAEICGKSILEILKELCDLLNQKDNLSDKVAYVRLCKNISRELEVIYKSFGASFAWLSECLKIEHPKVTLRRSNRGNLSHFAQMAVKEKHFKNKISLLKKPLDVLANENNQAECALEIPNLSNICNIFDDLVDNEQRRQILLESGFWSMFELLTEGNIELVAKIVCTVENNIKLRKIDRIIGVAWGGLPLASLLSLTLTAKKSFLPLSVLSLYPYLQIEPIPPKRESVLLVDSSLHSGFTAKSLAGKMGPYMTINPVKICSYLFGLAPKKTEMPLMEPEFRKICDNMMALAQCDGPEDFDKNDKVDPPFLTDSDMMANVDLSKIRAKADELRSLFHLSEHSVSGDNKKDFFGKIRADSSFIGVNNIGQQENFYGARVFRLYHFFDNPAILIEISRQIFLLFRERGIIPTTENEQNKDQCLVIAGGRNSVPFITGLSLFEMANRRSGRSPLKIFCARRMGERILHWGDQTLKRGMKVVIIDALLKDGVVAQSICEQIVNNLKEDQNAELGILAIASTDYGTKYITDYLQGIKNSKIRPLWQDGRFVHSFPTVDFGSNSTA